MEKYKTRFVARGFSQVKGIDYDETFAPVARYSSNTVNADGMEDTSDGCKYIIPQ